MNGPVVVKLGGATFAETSGLLTELAAASRQRPLVIVHGGGRRVTEWLARLGLPSRFADGLRVTDEAAIEVAAAVLRGAVNLELVAALRRLGIDAVGLSGVDGGLVVGRRVPGLGFVAAIAEVRRGLLDALFAEGRVPVVSPLALDETGGAREAVIADGGAAGALERAFSGADFGTRIASPAAAGVS